MNEVAAEYWRRATDTLRAARHTMAVSPDLAAADAYYAAFYAASALFAARNIFFRKHEALQAAVHRDLVHAGQWPPELGEAFNKLLQLRDIGHYGVAKHVPLKAAQVALEMASAILNAVAADRPDLFVRDDKL